MSQSSRYSVRPSNLSAFLMSDTQVCSCSASLTVLFFLILKGTHLTTLGARSSKQQPCIQRSVQKRVFLPFPTMDSIAVANIAEVLEYTGIWRPAQGWSGLVFSIQSHLNWSAQLIISRLWIPSPPRSIGLMILSQATKQLPPLALFLPVQRNPLLILSTARKNHLGTLIATRM